MNCEGVRAMIGKGFSATTVAERNAACVHCRGCRWCQSMVLDEISKASPPSIGEVLEAAALLAKDRADPEWK